MRVNKKACVIMPDSVFQIAAHEDVIPLEELYRACGIARKLTMQDEFTVGRIIARPYVGVPGHFKRASNRYDYAVKPPASTLLHTADDRNSPLVDPHLDNHRLLLGVILIPLWRHTFQVAP